MHYSVVYAEGSMSKALAKLEKQVNDLIKQGWTPLGGVASSPQGLNYFCSQAMIYNPAFLPTASQK